MSVQTIVDQTRKPPAMTDTRLIEFGRAAIATAIESVGVKMLGLPLGSKVKELTLDAATNSISFAYSGGQGSHSIQDGRLAAMMIAYCIAARVPISRTASKTVAVTQAGITLRFVTTLAIPPRP